MRAYSHSLNGGPVSHMARLIVVVLFCILAPIAFGQGNLGGVTGVVLDSSGAGVPEARLTLTSIQTNSSHTALTDAAGAYTFRGIPPGTYRLETEKEGFKKYVQENVAVLTATVTTLDLNMSLGAVSESVTVSSASVALQTTTPEVSTVLERRAILDLPIQVGGSGATTAASGRRQPENFIFLTPGVSGIPWSKNINGSPDFSQEVLYDGISGQLAVTPGFLAQTSPPYERWKSSRSKTHYFQQNTGGDLALSTSLCAPARINTMVGFLNFSATTSWILVRSSPLHDREFASTSSVDPLEVRCGFPSCTAEPTRHSSTSTTPDCVTNRRLMALSSACPRMRSNVVIFPSIAMEQAR